jgi:hypothetical protein
MDANLREKARLRFILNFNLLLLNERSLGFGFDLRHFHQLRRFFFNLLFLSPAWFGLFCSFNFFMGAGVSSSAGSVESVSVWILFGRRANQRVQKGRAVFSSSESVNGGTSVSIRLTCGKGPLTSAGQAHSFAFGDDLINVEVEIFGVVAQKTASLRGRRHDRVIVRFQCLQKDSADVRISRRFSSEGNGLRAPV